MSLGNVVMDRCVTLWIVCLALLPVAASSGVDHSYRYVAGAYGERAALASGGVCTGAREWDGDSWVDVPVVVGGACDIAVSGAVTVRVVDDAWDAVPGALGSVPFRWGLFGGSASGPAGEGVTCATGGTAWGTVDLVVPPGCDSLDVFVGELATSGRILVVG